MISTFLSIQRLMVILLETIVSLELTLSRMIRDKKLSRQLREKSKQAIMMIQFMLSSKTRRQTNQFKLKI